MMDPQIATYAALAVACASLLLNLVIYRENKEKATNARLAMLESDVTAQLTAQAQRIAHLETAAEAAPDHADLGKVYDSINDLAKVVNQLVGENKGQSDTLRLILSCITTKGLA